MSNDVLCSLNHKGECRIVNVFSDHSFADFVDNVFGMWPDLKPKCTSFRYTVGSISNCVLSADDDIKNMLLVCNYMGQKLVSVEVVLSIESNFIGSSSSCKLSRKSFESDTHINLPDESLDLSDDYVNHVVCNDLPNSNLCTQIKQKICRHSKLPFRSSKVFRDDGQYDEFSDMGSLPMYDICPAIVEQPLLSHLWGDIFKDGVRYIFSGGAHGFRTELIKHSTILGYTFIYLRNAANYIYVQCSNFSSCHCEWYIKARLQDITLNFEIYKAHLSRNCLGRGISKHHSRLSPKIIGNLVLHEVRENPNITGKRIVDILQLNYGITIPYYTGWRTGEQARDQLFGSYVDSYDQLCWYCDAVKRTNPGSVADLEYNPDTYHFERVFIAFNGCIEGFKSCRPMLFIDGTFMYGRVKGILLTATSKDGNNGLFPVAFAVVSAENTDNWVWFLKKISRVCVHPKQVFYISDMNCGLMPAFQFVFEKPLHFYCLFHLLTNLKGRCGGSKKLKGAKLIDLFKACAYAPDKRIFGEHLQMFKEVGGSVAAEFLPQLPFEKWAVAYSPEITRYGEMTSNAAESINAWIKKSRGLPITNMLDHIRAETSRWFFERRNKSTGWCSLLCPKKDLLWKNDSKLSRSWKVQQRNLVELEVLSPPPTSVDIGKRSCSCSKWQLSGFPCPHATAVINYHGPSISTYVDDCFLTSTYQKCYASDIHPIPDSERYSSQTYALGHKILSPNLKRMPGRPKKTRLKSFGEHGGNKKKRSGVS